jgi:hypothetical protein
MIYRGFSSIEKKADPNQPELSRATITMSTPDRSGDIVVASGIDLTDYNHNKIVLFQHGRDIRLGNRPIGKAHDLEIKRNKIDAEWEWDIEDPEVALLKHKWDADFLKGVSIGFIPKKVEEIPMSDEEKKDRWFPPLKFLESSLLEFSVVSIPMHQNALKKRSVEELHALTHYIPSLRSFDENDDTVKQFLVKLNAIEHIVQSLHETRTAFTMFPACEHYELLCATCVEKKQYDQEHMIREYNPDEESLQEYVEYLFQKGVSKIDAAERLKTCAMRDVLPALDTVFHNRTPDISSEDIAKAQTEQTECISYIDALLKQMQEL